MLPTALFQVFGWVAYLLPLALLVVGARWLMARPFEAPRTKMLGAGMLLVSLGALLELFPYTPAIHGVLRGGGLVGYLAAAGLIHTFNRLGASIVAATLFLASLFLVTRFSFGWAAEFLQKHWSRVADPTPSALERLAGGARRQGRGAPAQTDGGATRHRQAAGAAAKGGRPAGAARDNPSPCQPASAPAAAPPAKPETAEKPAPPPVVRMPKPTPASAPPKIVGRGAHGYKLPSATLAAASRGRGRNR